jgi:ribosomal protein S6--L-glutamate ligase
MKREQTPYIALGSRLRDLPGVRTLGVRPNFLDYPARERALILNAPVVLYPTLTYAQLLTTLGRPIFPSLETYLYADDKIKQTTLFYMQGLPHPKTRVYFHLHHGNILEDFPLPFVAKIPRASARGRGVFKIESGEDLQKYLQMTNVAYIQEYLPHDRDLRVVLINYQPILAYWRKRAAGDFRTNISQGGSIDFEDVPEEVLGLAREAALMCKFNDVGMDFISCRGKWFLVEANMKYGRKGLKMKGIDLKEVIRSMLLSGELSLPAG